MKESSPALRDLLRPGLDLVVCGTAAGSRSARVGSYYAGSGNKFWRILQEIKLTPGRLRPEEFESLPEFGIGLADLAKHYSGSDSGLRSGDYDLPGFLAKIEAMRPRVLAFNGKKAAKEFFSSDKVHYGRQETQVGETILLGLPSPSDCADDYWNPSHWRDLAHLVRELRAKS